MGLGCAFYGLFLIANTVHAVGGSDSSGYINAARMLARGRPVAPVPGLQELGLELGWDDHFVPLGLIDGPEPGTMVPYYPPGYPLLIAASAILFGWKTGPFLAPGIFAAVGLFLLYLLGRDLGLPPAYAASAAAILGAWPVYVWGGIQLMSDTVAAAWSIGAVLLATTAR